MLSAASYAFYAYVVIPLAISLYNNRFKICPLLKCIQPLVACAREPECRAALDCMAECDDEHSTRRQQSAQKFHHVQFPQDPSLCRYLCFDLIATPTAEDFLECVGQSGCMEPTKYSDQCAPISSSSVLPFDTVRDIFAGQWTKLYSTGWDTWPCQTTEFHAPLSQSPKPKPWMTAWPVQDNVWRMDLNWTNTATTHYYTFRMSNEIHPGQQWDFPSQPALNTTNATLKTRAITWGTEAHENWYLLHYDPEMRTMIIHYCAYTIDIKGFDAMTMVLRKVVLGKGQDDDPFTDEMAKLTEDRAMRLLGEKFGNLVRIGECSM